MLRPINESDREICFGETIAVSDDRLPLQRVTNDYVRAITQALKNAIRNIPASFRLRQEGNLGFNQSSLCHIRNKA